MHCIKLYFTIWEIKKQQQQKKVFHADMKTVGKPPNKTRTYGNDVETSREHETVLTEEHYKVIQFYA